MEAFDDRQNGGDPESGGGGSVGTIDRIRGCDWTGKKKITLTGRIPLATTTVGEIADEIRERMGIEPGSYDVYCNDDKLNRTDTLSAAQVVEGAELQLTPEVRAAGR